VDFLVAGFSDPLAPSQANIRAATSERLCTASVIKKSTYGYKRIEVMTALISAISLIVIAVFIFREACLRFLHPQPISRPVIFLSVAVIGLLGNIISVWLLHGERGKSLNMKTAFLHMAFDTISSVAVIIGGVVIILSGWLFVDVILSVIIALMIVFSSYRVIREAVLILLEAVPEGIEFDAVLDAMKQIPKVRGIHDLHIWSLSSSEVALSCHVCLDEADFQTGPDIIVEINKMLSERFHIGHGTIQIEKRPCDRNHLLCQYREHRWE
ncbi:MAG: cation diffusion facilitator family transporter, partial [candidate division Zixibacteria bacterium]|nr:cation diffusion facilitator family transporter [candidate division Zixibacteria bacterium]